VRRYANAGEMGLGPVLRRYLAVEGAAAPLAACVPSRARSRTGAGRSPNLDWSIDKDGLSEATGAPVTAILNDLQAQGHALGFLQAGTSREILPFPEASPHAAKLVVNVGTGFNIAVVFETEGGRLVPPPNRVTRRCPSAPRRTLRLARFIERDHGFAAVEEVLSGRGHRQVHDWLVMRPARTAGDLAEIMAALRAARSVRSGRRASSSATSARSAGDLALVTLPFGGIWLVGASRAPSRPTCRLGLREAFRDKGRFGPVHGWLRRRRRGGRQRGPRRLRVASVGPAAGSGHSPPDAASPVAQLRRVAGRRRRRSPRISSWPRQLPLHEGAQLAQREGLGKGRPSRDERLVPPPKASSA
jgi:glucokinase